MACVLSGGLIGAVAWFWLRGRRVYLVTVEESLKGAKMPPVATLMNAMVQDIVVALGGSFGREAAPREIAAMWGGWVGDAARAGGTGGPGAFGVTKEQRKVGSELPQVVANRVLVACGAGAGLAAVRVYVSLGWSQLSSQLTSALYTIEHVLNWDISPSAVLPAIVTSLIATVHHQKPDDFIPRSEEIMEEEFVGPEEFVNFVHSTDMIPYVLATSHVVKSRMKYDTKSRSKNFMFWMIFLFLLQCCQAAPATCLADGSPPPPQLSDEHWLALFAAAPLAIAVIAFLLGRWSKGEKKEKEEMEIEEEKVTTADAFTQKDEPVVHARLREALKTEQARVNEYKLAARESRRAVDLAMTEILNLRPLVQDAAPMFRRLITAMDDHMDQCPHRQPIVASKKNGICWHFPTCHCAEQITEPNLLQLRICAYCGDHRSPLDFPSPNPSVSQGNCLREEVTTWLADYNVCRWPNWQVCLWALLVGPIAGLGASAFRRFVKFVEGYKPLGRFPVEFHTVKLNDEVWITKDNKDGSIERVFAPCPTIVDQTIEALPAKVRAAEADEEYGEEEEIREEDWDDSAHAEGNYPSLLGNGRALAEIAMQRQRSTPFLAMLLLLKALMTAAAIGSGAAGGTLTPSVALGATLGAVLGDQDSRMSVVAAAAFLSVAMNSPVSLAECFDQTKSKTRSLTTVKVSAAAAPEFNVADPVAHATGKRVATTSGMKTVFAAESSLNIARRIRNASVPLGCAVEDDAAVTEDTFYCTKALEVDERMATIKAHRQRALAPQGGSSLQVTRRADWGMLKGHPLLHLPPALIYHVSRTLRKPLIVVLNKLDAVDPANATSWAEALSAVPGISAIVGYSKENLRKTDFKSLKVGKESLIEVSHQVYDSVAKDAKQTKQAALMLEHSDIEDLAFIESRDFTGARKGYVFGTGPQGTGFYRDRAQLAQPWAQPAAPVATEAEEEAPEEEVSNEVASGSIMLGLIGHPNVGKSSMVNHLMGEKVVSVKATPGHTKILQTLKLNETTFLCDSPGVVFPRLEVPREAQIVGMLVPLAQVREPFSAIRWVMERSLRPMPDLLGLKPVPLRRVREFFDAGLETLQLNLVDAEDENEVVPWSPMLLCAQFAAQRGFVQNGRPDCMKAGTEILERVLQGRIAYCVPPPTDASCPELPEDACDSDWKAFDEDFESEEEEEEIGDRDLLELFGQEARGIGRSSKAAIKRFKRRQKLAEVAGEADPARTLRPFAGRLKEVECATKS
ncbi:Guanine nucleotide-binding protein-like 1 (GTP-binding protein MMR1) [Durusdinium trenchii]|uniref:Guanine nucleotide-binding protein-like 1 n=1 Tax=Durusdinium trenchii TaxID=1381693 RepID=A0ABP0Q292_9DINO